MGGCIHYWSVCCCGDCFRLFWSLLYEQNCATSRILEYSENFLIFFLDLHKFAFSEGILSLLCAAFIIFLGYQVGTGSMGSMETKYTTDLIAIGIIFIPILIGFIACVLLLLHFGTLKRLFSILIELARVKASVEGRNRASSEDGLWADANVYGTEGL
jgi:hypothetical protein